MTQDYSTEAQTVADAMNAVYENKQTNKKTSLSGDYSTDNESYPTCKAVNDKYGNVKTSWASTPSDSDIPSEKLVKDSLDNKSNTGHTHTTTDITNLSIPTKTSDLTNDGDGTNVFVKTNDSRLTDARTPTSHTQATSTITNTTAYDNIKSGESTTLTLTDLSQIISAINEKLGTLANLNLNAYEITSDKGTATASKMGKLYIVSENSKVNVYYVIETDGGYDWDKLDSNILDELEVTWSSITGKPSFGTGANDFATGNHTHGSITNDGKVGTTSGKPLITGTDGVVTTGAFGTSSGQFAEGNHTHSYTSASDVEAEIGAFATALANAINPSS